MFGLAFNLEHIITIETGTINLFAPGAAKRVFLVVARAAISLASIVIFAYCKGGLAESCKYLLTSSKSSCISCRFTTSGPNVLSSINCLLPAAASAVLAESKKPFLVASILSAPAPVVT